MPPFSDHHDMTDCCLRRTRLPSQSFTHSVSSIVVVVGGVNTTVFGLLGLPGLLGLLGLLGLDGSRVNSAIPPFLLSHVCFTDRASCVAHIKAESSTRHAQRYDG